MLLLALWLQVAAPALADTTPPVALAVSVKPESPLLVRGRSGLELQCDLIVSNPGTLAWRLDEVEATALDAGGRPISIRHLGSNGTAPSIDILHQRTLGPGGRLQVFNPLWSYDADAPPATVRFRLTFSEDAKGSEREQVVETTVKPEPYVQKNPLVLPLKGRILVWDGHDFLSHHRRLNFTHPAFVQMGIANNPLRYAYDLSVVDEDGRMWRTDGKAREDWYGWQVPVFAPGDGTVAEIQDAVPDHKVGENLLTIPEILANPRVLAGNYVVIDHGQGEHSLIAHLQQGSLGVKVGDVVKKGQPIAKMGFSGDAFTVHVHYELRRGVPFDVEGLPSVFTGYERAAGSRRIPVAEGVVDTGDIVFVP